MAAPTVAEWVTLQEAHAATGIPVNTLRKWARRGYVDSHVDETAHGMRRMLRFDTVVGHAAEVDRAIAPIEQAMTSAAPESVLLDPTPPPSAEGRASQPSEGVPDPAPETAADDAQAPPTVEPPPEGTMIVPIDAWNKMLLQLGNLHEAGQQLAEARERAARAETEASFFRERLAELRARPEQTTPPEPATAPEPPRHDPPAARTVTVPAPARSPQGVEPWWAYVSRRWRSRRR